MAATFTWSIPTVEHTIADGGINVAHWRCDGSETVGSGDDAVTYTASSYGTVGFSPDPDSDDFIAYDSVTEANVIAWVQAEVDQSETETALQNQINADKTPTTGSGTPW